MTTFTGTNGVDTFIGAGTIGDTFRFRPSNLAPTDTVVGGNGAIDRLIFSASGSVIPSLLSGVSQIEIFALQAPSVVLILGNKAVAANGTRWAGWI